MQHVVDPVAGVPAGVDRSNVGFEEAEEAPSRLADDRPHLVEIAPVAGGEVVEADNRLVERQQRLDQV